MNKIVEKGQFKNEWLWRFIFAQLQPVLLTFTKHTFPSAFQGIFLQLLLKAELYLKELLLLMVRFPKIKLPAIQLNLWQTPFSRRSARRPVLLLHRQIAVLQINNRTTYATGLPPLALLFRHYAMPRSPKKRKKALLRLPCVLFYIEF